MYTKYAVAIAIIIIVIGGLYFMFDAHSRSSNPSGSNPDEASSQSTNPNPTPPPAETGKIENATSLKVETEKQGTGNAAKAGDQLTVNYTGSLTDGTVFDSSIPRGQPFVFTLGAGRVIRGWDQGLVGMKVGEKRKLTIPSDLGYGATGQGPIPPNATLIFEVELLKIN